MGCVIMMKQYSTFPHVSSASSKFLIKLFTGDFKPTTGPALDAKSVKSKTPTDYVIGKRHALIWCDIITDICMEVANAGMSEASTHMIIPMLPLANACGYWDLPKNKILGGPPIPEEFVKVAMSLLVGEPGEKIDLDKPPSIDDLHRLFDPYKSFDQPKENKNKPDEKEDKFFDFDGLGGRFGVN